MARKEAENLQIQYRPARVEDCPHMAGPIYQTSGGILDYLYEGLLRDESVVESLALFLRREDRYDGYRSAIVAEFQNEIIGVVSSYPSACHRIDQEMKEFFPPERLEFVREFFSTRVEGGYYLSAIYVQEQFRQQGVARQLIELTKQRGRAAGYDSLSLLVMADNLSAQTAYLKSGLQIVRHVDLGEHPLIPHQGGLYLMATSI